MKRNTSTMLRKTNLVKIAIGFCSILILFACRKEQPEMNAAVDPCACAKEVTAEFTMEEMSAWNFAGAFYSETDSILINRYVRFTAKEEDAEYTWYLGTETETTRETFRQFPTELAGTTQPIILVVKKEPNTTCFPDDDGYDSVVKYLTLTEYPINDWVNQDIFYGSKEGVFKMKPATGGDSIEIRLDYVRGNGALNWAYINIYDYDGKGSNCIEEATGYTVTYRETRLDGQGATSCNRLRGYIKTPMNGVVEMYFTEFEPGHADYKVYHYFGRRVGPL